MSELDRTESTIVNYRGGDASRFNASVNEAGVVALSLQTVETSVAFSLRRDSLVELATFLNAVVADLGPSTIDEPTEDSPETTPEEEPQPMPEEPEA